MHKLSETTMQKFFIMILMMSSFYTMPSDHLQIHDRYKMDALFGGLEIINDPERLRAMQQFFRDEINALALATASNDQSTLCAYTEMLARTNGRLNELLTMPQGQP